MKNSAINRCLILVLILIGLTTSGCRKLSVEIIPQPDRVNVSFGEVSFSSLSIVSDDQSLENVQKVISGQVQNDFDIRPSSDGDRRTVKVLLRIDNSIDHSEGYLLTIGKKSIVIAGSTPHGVFNGCQSLIQLIHGSEMVKGVHSLPKTEIRDQPRYRWRGFMLDESRHFYGKEKVKQTLDLMALHKLNIFHWHLTDAPGWRIEIKKYPRLTEVGAIGNQSDPKAAAAFYTQDEIREIVAYAAERFIEIIPEIDMPGHASAATLAYPTLSGGGTDRYPNFTYNPGKEITYRFLTDVLHEVVDLFPAPYIHIGGDEVSFGNKHWGEDADIVALRTANDLEDFGAVEHYFINRMYDTVTNLGKTFIGWDEVTHAKVNNEESVVMWWRHDKRELIDEILNMDYQTVLCPRIPMYLDFVQDSVHKYGRRWKGEFCDLEKVYRFPDDMGIDAESEKIMGIQANLWTNRISSEQSFDYLTWPRLSAVAEAAWTGRERKDFRKFKKKLKGMHALYDQYELYYFDFFQPNRRAEPLGSGPQKWQLRHESVN